MLLLFGEPKFDVNISSEAGRIRRILPGQLVFLLNVEGGLHCLWCGDRL